MLRSKIVINRNHKLCVLLSPLIGQQPQEHRDNKITAVTQEFPSEFSAQCAVVGGLEAALR